MQVRNASALSGATSSAALSASASAHAAPSAGSIVRVQPRSRAVPPSSAYRASVAGGKLGRTAFLGELLQLGERHLLDARVRARHRPEERRALLQPLSEPFFDDDADDDGRECDDDAHSTGECCGGVSCTYWPRRPRGWRRARLVLRRRRRRRRGAGEAAGHGARLQRVARRLRAGTGGVRRQRCRPQLPPQLALRDLDPPCHSPPAADAPRGAAPRGGGGGGARRGGAAALPSARRVRHRKGVGRDRRGLQHQLGHGRREAVAVGPHANPHGFSAADAQHGWAHQRHAGSERADDDGLL